MGDTSVGAITAPAPVEGGVGRSHPYNIRVSYLLEKASGSESILVLLTDVLKGAGRVDLVKLEVSYFPSVTAQSLTFAVTSTTSGASLSQLSGDENSVHFTSNSFTAGIKNVTSIVPPDTISRQIQPNSADLPAMQILWDRSKDMTVHVIFYLHFTGFINLYRTLKA